MRKIHLTIALTLLSLCGAFSFGASVSPAQAGDLEPGIVLNGADFYRFRVGSVTVTALSDGTVPQDLHVLLRSTTVAKTDALLEAGFLRNPVEVSINAFLVALPDRLVLVDTGAGELFGAGKGGGLVDSLAAAGYRPEQITDILLTHIHSDHSGGLTVAGRRIFPNATVHVGQPDLDFFLDPENAARIGYGRLYFVQAIRTVKPYVDAGKVVGFAKTTEVVPGIVATLHPGHTPGSAFYTLESQGQRLTFIGDIIHVAAVQLPEPGVTIVYDVDPKGAAATRAQAFSAFAHDRALIAAPHLPFPGVGHVRQVGTGYQWVPVDYGNRQTD